MIAESPAAPDIRLFFEATPGCYVVLAPDLTVVAASDAYLHATRTRRDELVGKKIMDALPQNPDDPEGEAVREAFRTSTERFLRALSLRGEERLRRMLDAAPDAMIVVDSEATIRFVNAQTEALFGHPQSELLGQPLDTLVPHRFRASHTAHIRRYFEKPSLRTMGSGLELFGLRRDGTELPIEVSLNPLALDGRLSVVAAIRDISERKRLQATTDLALTRLASAVESIQDAFALFDEADRLALCNSVYRRLFAPVLPGPLIGRHYDELLDAWLEELDLGDDRQRAAFREDCRSRRQEPKVELNVRTRDGRSLRIIGRRTPEGGVVETIWDLTEDARLAAELREARAAAEAASAAKSEFLSSMSHELRTPLNAILGFSQLLQRDKRRPLSDQHRERVDQILRGGEHLLRLIDDILDLSRIEAGGVSISPEPVDVLVVLEEVRTTLGPTAGDAGIRVELSVVAANVPMIAADRTRFTQILMNFGSNAVKYNRTGGAVTLTVSAPSPERVRVTVSDTGMGIPADKHAILFQPFQRAGQETGPIEGTGIGLAITKRLAELMDGSVGFRSVHGEGSDFWVEMPVHAAHVSSSVPPEVRVAPAHRLDEARRALLLYVEDNPANVKFMEALLETFENIDLVVARSAEAGLETARDKQPDVIIIDINLPGMSGLDALRVLRSWPETARIPVIALTAAASDRDRRRGEEAGFHRYLTKPIKVDDLEAALQTLLS